MTNKERALNILHYKAVDRLPAVHFGYWNELLPEWVAQGHIPQSIAENWGDGNDADMELDKILGWDFNWYHTKGSANSLYPAFEYKVIEELPDGFKRVQNAQGLIERIRDGAGSIPSEDDYLLKDRKAYEELFKPKLEFSTDRIDYNYFKNVHNTINFDYPIGLSLGSVLGDIRNMMSVIGMSYMMCDDYDLLVEFVDTYAELQYKCAEEILKTGARFDFGHFWEDICFKNGPLVSPAVIDELTAKHYKKRCDLCHKYGIDIISLDCDGVTGKLLDIWYENGVNTMFPIEVGTWGDQFAAARKKFGTRMLGVGAMDKTALRKDKAAIDDEIERIKPLIELGGFIPCPDHRLMPGTKFELVQYYIDKIKSLTM